MESELCWSAGGSEPFAYLLSNQVGDTGGASTVQLKLIQYTHHRLALVSHSSQLSWKPEHEETAILS